MEIMLGQMVAYAISQSKSSQFKLKKDSFKLQRYKTMDFMQYSKNICKKQ